MYGRAALFFPRFTAPRRSWHADKRISSSCRGCLSRAFEHVIATFGHLGRVESSCSIYLREREKKKEERNVVKLCRTRVSSSASSSFPESMAETFSILPMAYGLFVLLVFIYYSSPCNFLLWQLISLWELYGGVQKETPCRRLGYYS